MGSTKPILVIHKYIFNVPTTKSHRTYSKICAHKIMNDNTDIGMIPLQNRIIAHISYIF